MRFKKILMRASFLFVLLLTFKVAHARGPQIQRGALPEFSYPDLQQNIDKIWDFVVSSTHSSPNLNPPRINFSPFIFSKQVADWTEWQKDWIKNHPEIWDDWKRTHKAGQAPSETGNPFPTQFFAFHYDGSDRIQINPYRTFLPFYTNDPYGEKHDYTGFGYYVSGHEMHHYALEALGINPRIHHCLFLKERHEGQNDSLMHELAAFVIEQKVSADIIYYIGLRPEIILNPCQKLSPQELAEVDLAARKLANTSL